LPYVTNRGQRIHYAVEGSGPLVVMQHGFASNGADNWKQPGFVDALTDRFQVAYVDALGHGLSDKPADPARYAREQRASDVVAVIDDLCAERAHLVGYSMGALMSLGVAKHSPERLASLTLGGWDPVKGRVSARPPGVDEDMSFEQVLGVLRFAAPTVVAWVTPETEPGLRASWDALSETDGTEEQAILATGVPTFFWSGRDDPYHDPMQAFAANHGLEFLSIQGNHLSAITDHGQDAARGLRTFLEKH